MKNIFILFMLFFGAQQLIGRNVCNVYTPVDSVPEWVKEKVTQEEYNLWKTMSSIYQIDYSFLKRNIPNDKRKHFYSGIKRMCESIKKGEYSSK